MILRRTGSFYAEAVHDSTSRAQRSAATLRSRRQAIATGDLLKLKSEGEANGYCRVGKWAGLVPVFARY